MADYLTARVEALRRLIAARYATFYVSLDVLLEELADDGNDEALESARAMTVEERSAILGRLRDRG